MPSKSKKQHNFMAAVANNPKFAKRVGVPKSVGEEFMKMDKKKYQVGGKVEDSPPKEDWQAMGYPSEKVYERVRDEKIDRKMQEAAEEHKKTRVGGGNKKQQTMPKVEMAKGGKVGGSSCGMKKYAKGGAVRGCGMAKKGVRPAKMR